MPAWVAPWKLDALGPLRPLVLKARTVGIKPGADSASPVYDDLENESRKLLKAFKLDADELARAGIGPYLFTLVQSYDAAGLIQRLLRAEAGTYVSSMSESVQLVRMDSTSDSSRLRPLPGVFEYWNAASADAFLKTFKEDTAVRRSTTMQVLSALKRVQKSAMDTSGWIGLVDRVSSTGDGAVVQLASTEEVKQRRAGAVLLLMALYAARLGVGVDIVLGGWSSPTKLELVALDEGSPLASVWQSVAKSRDGSMEHLVASCMRTAHILGAMGIVHLDLWNSSSVSEQAVGEEDPNARSSVYFVKAKMDAKSSFPENGSKASKLFTLLALALDLADSPEGDRFGGAKAPMLRVVWRDILAITTVLLKDSAYGELRRMYAYNAITPGTNASPYAAKLTEPGAAVVAPPPPAAVPPPPKPLATTTLEPAEELLDDDSDADGANDAAPTPMAPPPMAPPPMAPPPMAPPPMAPPPMAPPGLAPPALAPPGIPGTLPPPNAQLEPDGASVTWKGRTVDSRMAHWKETGRDYNPKGNGAETAIQRWPDSVWGNKGTLKLGVGNAIYWDKEQLPQEALEESFGIPVPKVPKQPETDEEIAAAEKKAGKEALQLRQQANNILGSERSRNTEIVIRKYAIAGTGHLIANDIKTCFVLARSPLPPKKKTGVDADDAACDDDTGDESEGLLLSFPGDETIQDFLIIVRDTLLPPKIDKESKPVRAPLEAAFVEKKDQLENFSPANAMVYHLFQVPELDERINHMVAALERRDKLQREVRAEARRFISKVDEVMQLSVVGVMLERVLRAVNALRQGREGIWPRSGLQLGVRYKGKKPDFNIGADGRLDDYTLPEVLKALRSPTKSGKPSLVTLIVRQLVGEYGGVDPFIEALRADVMPKTTAPRTGSEPLNESILATEDDGISETWFSDAEALLAKERQAMQAADAFVAKLYSANRTDPDDKVFAWRYSVITKGKQAANTGLDAAWVASAENSNVYAEARKVQKATVETGQLTEDDHDNLMDSMREELARARSKAEDVLRFAGRPPQTNLDGTMDDARTVIDATIVLRTLTHILGEMWRATRAIKLSASSRKRGKFVGTLSSFNKPSPITVEPVGAQLYDSDDDTLYNESEVNVADRTHTRLFARRMEKRIGQSLRSALDKHAVRINRSQVGDNANDATILHAAHALAGALLA